MKKYLSFGGGVNSVAMMLLMIDQREDFEAIFVDHGTDWPETYEYLEVFQSWLENNGHQKITVLKPDVEGYDTLYDYLWHYKMVPSSRMRFCTDKFKVRVVQNYVETPCFMYIGIDFGELKRAKISTTANIENRYPLIEHEIDRNACKEIIISHGLDVPIKSGCFICPFQRVSQWKELRMLKPDLFCKAEQLENRSSQYRIDRGLKPIRLSASNKNLRQSLKKIK